MLDQHLTHKENILSTISNMIDELDLDYNCNIRNDGTDTIDIDDYIAYISLSFANNI